MADDEIDVAKAMNTAVAIFVKTPTLSPVKTRLAASIGEKAVQEFYHLSLKAVEKTLKSTEVVPYWAVAEKNGIKNSLWKNFSALHTGEGNLGERQHHIYESLLVKHDRVLLIGADAPQLSKNILDNAILTLDTHDFVIGPARDGGYYLFGGRVSTAQEFWASVPWSTSMTRERLEAVLPSKPVHLPILTDVDTKEDLPYVLEEMIENRNEYQRQIMEWIKKQ